MESDYQAAVSCENGSQNLSSLTPGHHEVGMVMGLGPSALPSVQSRLGLLVEGLNLPSVESQNGLQMHEQHHTTEQPFEVQYDCRFWLITR